MNNTINIQFKANRKDNGEEVTGEKVGNFILTNMGAIISHSDTRFMLNRDYFHEIDPETLVMVVADTKVEVKVDVKPTIPTHEELMNVKIPSILVLGNMCFDEEHPKAPKVCVECANDGLDDCDCAESDCTIITDIQMVISGHDTELLNLIGEDFVEGTNETGKNPHNLTIDAYFIDTEHSKYNYGIGDNDIYVWNETRYYTFDTGGYPILFDEKARTVCGFADMEELEQMYPKAVKMEYSEHSDICSSVLLS